MDGFTDTESDDDEYSQGGGRGVRDGVTWMYPGDAASGGGRAGWAAERDLMADAEADTRALVAAEEARRGGVGVMWRRWDVRCTSGVGPDMQKTYRGYVHRNVHVWTGERREVMQTVGQRTLATAQPGGDGTVSEHEAVMAAAARPGNATRTNQTAHKSVGGDGPLGSV